MPSPAQPPTDPYVETLTPGVGLVAAALGLGLFVVLALLPVGQGIAFGAAVVVVAIALVAARVTSPVVEVRSGTLRAGGARIPTAVLGDVVELRGEDLRRAIGTELDARAYLCHRAWTHAAVRVDLRDPQDPTPYWIVSTRRPAELARALRDSTSA
ncbi:DUF3093 domain-containing protein [Cellulomonas sp. PhB143]|uniref:DUF3093 domain-containing protein n=1 Tax=Cellulomonas sp. PhB143 TaxID=2485186 RepID=UPI000FA1BAD6|nr:DUF3093 domain-containing protein [Cellulomonas sp. PhB143]ROS72984.1 DUF3093 family protein [Cellulomonas sp. PhB143]